MGVEKEVLNIVLEDLKDNFKKECYTNGLFQKIKKIGKTGYSREKTVKEIVKIDVAKALHIYCCKNAVSSRDFSQDNKNRIKENYFEALSKFIGKSKI